MIWPARAVGVCETHIVCVLLEGLIRGQICFLCLPLMITLTGTCLFVLSPLSSQSYTVEAINYFSWSLGVFSFFVLLSF